MVIILAIVLVGFCVLALAVRIIVKKNGQFPETGVGKNRNMRKLGIRCTKQDEIIRWRQMKGETVNPDELCCGCDDDECTLEQEKL
jgi:hypothetical protein